MILKRSFYLILFLVAVSCGSTKTIINTNSNVSKLQKLKAIKNVVQVEKTKNTSHFDENYELWFEQPIDHNDPSQGTFKQRVFLGYETSDQPVIVELRGYAIGSNKAGELAAHYEANQLTIEHRYFSKSRPETIDWNTLTIENAAKDQAIIIDAIREALFPKSKFVTTGISKGCQTTMAHRRFFPKNVDASVCYVGPLNYQREDPRVYEFLKTVGTEKDRKRIQDFQELCFKNRDALLDRMRSEAKNKDMSWEFGIDNAIDYTILEYAFAFWQWGHDVHSIPSTYDSINMIYDHLIDVVGYGFFEDRAVKGLQPYFWAALTEQGIYGYETAPFKKYLGTDVIYKFDWAFPEGISKAYNLKPMQEIKSYLDRSAKKILFIYGEYDAWSATAVELQDNASKRELYKFVKPKGDHKTRIKSFGKEDRDRIYSIIDGWLK